MPRSNVLLLSFFVLAAAGCDERQVSTDAAAVPADQAPDRPPGDLTASDVTVPDGAVPVDLPLTPDKASATDASACFCKAPQVWLRGDCVPTTKLGCGPTCSPTSPTSCPTNYKCDPCAAAPSCSASSCRPACVPGMAMKFSSGNLRVTPTQGVAGKPVTLTVSGGAFYIGAMFWVMHLGSIVANVTHVGTCRVKATFIPPKPGLYPVQVRYTNGTKATLAGFYLASGGSIPPPTAQPGYPCSASLKCAQAKPYTCSCVKGRCQCK